eukprot:537885-Amphidinium_carterae.1
MDGGGCVRYVHGVLRDPKEFVAATGLIQHGGSTPLTSMLRCLRLPEAADEQEGGTGIGRAGIARFIAVFLTKGSAGKKPTSVAVRRWGKLAGRHCTHAHLVRSCGNDESDSELWKKTLEERDQGFWTDLALWSRLRVVLVAIGAPFGVSLWFNPPRCGR